MILLVLIAAAIAGAFAIKHVYDKAMSVRAQLTTAIPLVQTVRDDILALDSAKAQTDATRLATITSAAKADANDSLWTFMEPLPLIGPNLAAIRTAADVTDDIASQVITPLSTVSLDSLTPKDGRVDLDAIRQVGTAMATAKVVLASSDEKVTAIERDALLPQVSDAIDSIAPKLTEASTAINDLEPIVQLLPRTLGGEGPRNYLLVFQNNAEANSLGGITASQMLVTVDDGAIQIGAQSSRQEFSDTEITVDPAVQALYGENLATDLNSSTSRPDFPTAADIQKQFWEARYGGTINGVLDVDPIALAGVLGATGPIAVGENQEITSDNAVSLLLNKVYFRYPDATIDETNDLTDAFFAGVSKSIFDKLLSGAATPSKLLPAIVTGVNEHRILAWSSDPTEQALIATTPMAGILPTDNTATTLTGVFFRDASLGSKLSYYLDSAVTQTSSGRCAAAPATFTTTVSLTNTLTAEEADDLPAYIRSGSGNIPSGDAITQAYVFGPPGTTVQSVTVQDDSGRSVNVTNTTDLGRPVANVSLYLEPGETVSATAVFVGADGQTYAPQSVTTTPMVRPTTVTLSDETCSG